MNYEGILEFHGTWRSYQARVLQNVSRYLSDDKIHIVAAPGSGKTTLGIELIKRLNANTLILAPSITIREQWAARIQEAFLCDGYALEDYVSLSLKQPKAITVATYQALHSAMTRFCGTETPGEDTAPTDSEEVDYSDFDLVRTMKNANIELLCLDECHHLRSEWWKSLEAFQSQLSSLKTISLTATPPYDSTPAMWTRYMNMCGDIDEEITIPELVKEGSLCPHQDYVYFNYPTTAETKEIQNFEERSSQMLQSLMQDSQLLTVIETHKGLNGQISDDLLLDDPEYLEAILIYLQSKHTAFPARLQRLLGTKKLPAMGAKWMERLLQGFLYDDSDSYLCDKVYREMLIDQLKSQGLIEKKKVILTKSAAVEKLLTNSLGKANSIRDIVFSEYDSMGSSLRLLILTDYIRKEYEKAIGNPEATIASLGVLPFFEMLRRENEKQHKAIRLGVLCGSVVIIPAEAKETLLQQTDAKIKLTFSAIGSLSENDYLKVTATGDAHALTAAVTAIFAQGAMQVLIGTKSLLGEGWDSPCINSLILASFVGSFMLSNQMRGRAIRVWKEDPNKTSNIWHLVCLKPRKEVQQNPEDTTSEDYTLLCRRMEQFLGLHYTEDTIENGIDRLSIIRPPFTKSNAASMNRKMLALSQKRSELKDRWMRSLAVYDKMEVVNTNEIPDKYVTSVLFWDALRALLLTSALLLVGLIFALGTGFASRSAVSGVIGFFMALYAGGVLLTAFPKLFMLGSPLRRLKAFGNGILKALETQNFLEEPHCKVVSGTSGSDHHVIFLSGGSGRDKALFAQCVNDFFDAVDNQRYLLVSPKRFRGLNGFYVVPECFSKRKEDAQLFAKCMKPYIGAYDVVYTRNEKGRAILLEGKIKALANREERCIRRKKMNG